MYWWLSKYVKSIVSVNVNNSVEWDVDNFVGAGFRERYGYEVDIDIGDEVGVGLEL